MATVLRAAEWAAAHIVTLAHARMVQTARHQQGHIRLQAAVTTRRPIRHRAHLHSAEHAAAVSPAADLAAVTAEAVAAVTSVTDKNEIMQKCSWPC